MGGVTLGEALLPGELRVFFDGVSGMRRSSVRLQASYGVLVSFRVTA